MAEGQDRQRRNRSGCLGDDRRGKIKFTKASLSNRDIDRTFDHGEHMTYYIGKTLATGIDDAVAKVTEALKAEGFGILTQIDVKSTLKQKIGVDFRAYRILGACNPALAHKALQAEDKIGVMFPCNVIVQDVGDGRVEVAAVNPLDAMGRVENPALTSLAKEVSEKLSRVVEGL